MNQGERNDFKLLVKKDLPLGLPLVKQMENYTSAQLRDVQDRCWNIGKDMIDAALAGNTFNYHYHSPEEETTKTIYEQANRFAHSIQISKGLFLPIIQGSLLETLRFPNFHRPFSVWRTDWVFAASLYEIKRKQANPNYHVRLLNLFLDEANKPFTIAKLEKLATTP